MRGTDAHCPFVFLLWFFVSSFLPPCPWGPSCTACLSPSPRSCFSFLLPLFLHPWLFSWAFVFPCWSLCLDLSSLLPYGCSCPSLGSMAPCSPNGPGGCLLQTHRRSCPRLAHLPDGRASARRGKSGSLLLASSWVQLAEAKIQVVFPGSEPTQLFCLKQLRQCTGCCYSQPATEGRPRSGLGRGTKRREKEQWVGCWGGDNNRGAGGHRWWTRWEVTEAG